MARKDWRVTRPSVLLKDIDEFFEFGFSNSRRSRITKVESSGSFPGGSGGNCLVFRSTYESIDFDIEESPPTPELFGSVLAAPFATISTKQKISGPIKGSFLLNINRAEWEQEDALTLRTYSLEGATINIFGNYPENLVADWSLLNSVGIEALILLILERTELATIVLQRLLSPTFSLLNVSGSNPGICSCSLLPGFAALQGPSEFSEFTEPVFSGLETEATLKVEFYSYSEDEGQTLRWGIKVDKITGSNSTLLQGDYSFNFDEFESNSAAAILYEGFDIDKLREIFNKAFEERSLCLTTSGTFFPNLDSGYLPEQIEINEKIDDLTIEVAEGNEIFGESSTILSFSEAESLLPFLFLVGLGSDYFGLFGG